MALNLVCLRSVTQALIWVIRIEILTLCLAVMVQREVWLVVAEQL